MSLDSPDPIGDIVSHEPAFVPPVATPAEIDTARTALVAFGVRPEETELASIAAGWSFQRAAIDQLYAAPEVQYAQPALRFRADAVAVDWTG